ncbi:MAG: C25 family cysteine peptidase, partial [Acidobacteriota bacterium]
MVRPLSPQRVRSATLRAGVAARMLAVCAAAAAASPVASSAASLSIHVVEPGVYRLPFEATAPHVLESRGGQGGIPSASLDLTFRGQSLPFWVDDGGDGWLDPGERLLFVAPADRLWPPSLHDETPRAVVQLHVAPANAEGAALEGSAAGPAEPTGAAATAAPAAEPPAMDPAALRRRKRFEEDHFRLPATRDAPVEDLGSLWFWATLSERSSTGLEIDLGPLDDRAGAPVSSLTIRAGVVGWSNPEVPGPETQHRVDVRLGDRLLGSERWDGRRPREIRLDGVPIDVLGASENRLSLSVPSRSGADGDPIIDLVYVDWVEVEYAVGRGTPDPSAPLHLPASAEPRWLPGDARGGAARVLAEAGWSAPFADGGWRLPPGPGTDVWIVSDAELRDPLALVPAAPPPTPGSELDYLIIAPSPLLDGARRLAAIHGGRGLAVDVVEAGAIFEAHDWGHRSTRAIRAFLDGQLGRSPDLRYVLLVGDADWFTPSEASRIEDSSKLPTGTRFSESGPAASDHIFAASPDDPTNPRFAVGR